MKRTVVLALATLTLAAGGPPIVKKLLRPMTSLYDKAGNPTRRVDSTTIPVPAAIVDYNAREQIGIKLADGAVVYLRPSEIETENETGPCLAVTNAAESSGRHVAASAGIHSGMSANSAPCVRK